MIQKRSILRAGVALALASWLGGALAQSGNHTTIVLPYPPGGATDTLARLISERLQARLGHPVVVEYKPGGNHAIANQYVNSQPANGRTLYLIATPFSSAPAANPAVHKYHPVNDFTPVARLTQAATVLVANANFPATTVAEVVAHAKANPGKVQFATTGLGTQDHLVAWRLGKQAGVDFNIVHYKGSAQAFQDLIGGHVDLKLDSYASAKPALDSGRGKLIAVSDATPSPLLPGQRTVHETLPGIFMASYFGIVGPRGMPADVTARLSSMLAEIIRSDDIASQLRTLAMAPAPLAPADFAKYINERYADIQSMVKESGIKVE